MDGGFRVKPQQLYSRFYYPLQLTRLLLPFRLPCLKPMLPIYALLACAFQGCPFQGSLFLNIFLHDVRLTRSVVWEIQPILGQGIW